MTAAKRALKIILIGTAAVAGLAAVAAGGLFVYAAIDKEDTFYLADTEPADPNLHGQYLREFLLGFAEIVDAVWMHDR